MTSSRPWADDAGLPGFQTFNVCDVRECLALAAPDLITNLAKLPEPATDVTCGGKASR